MPDAYTVTASGGPAVAINKTLWADRNGGQNETQWIINSNSEGYS